MSLSKHYAGYRWIKVKKYVRDFNKTAAEQYRNLDDHHMDETSFLIDEVRKLAKQWDERENAMVKLVDALEFLSMQCKDRAKQHIINGREVSEIEREVNEAYADVYDFCVANLKKILDQTKPAK